MYLRKNKYVELCQTLIIGVFILFLSSFSSSSSSSSLIFLLLQGPTMPTQQCNTGVKPTLLLNRPLSLPYRVTMPRRHTQHSCWPTPSTHAGPHLLQPAPDDGERWQSPPHTLPLLTLRGLVPLQLLAQLTTSVCHALVPSYK